MLNTQEAQQERGTWEVPHTYFPPRTACRVTLYGDAHQEADKCPEFKLADGLTYKEIGAWDDIYTVQLESLFLMVSQAQPAAAAVQHG